MSGEKLTGNAARGAAMERYTHVFGVTSNTWLAIFSSASIMLALALAVDFFGVPNPNMILVTGLVVCASVFGFRGSIVSAAIMMVYTLAFFSTGHDFTTFTEEGARKVVVSAAGIIVITLFVSVLRLFAERAFRELQKANALLEEDNQQLVGASTVDALTGARNRFALRRDFVGYLGKNLHVMMVDADDFKRLNDVYGHQVGDAALTLLGAHLVDEFGRDRVYRYGGDEFLVMGVGEDEGAFATKVQKLLEDVAAMEIGDSGAAIHLSVGYVFGSPEKESDLRLMIRQADANLYQSKNAGKNKFTGCAYSKSAAESATISRREPAGRVDNVGSGVR